ncbi:hypothetical protein AHF37_06806 [Paragonimus kellicotti]|nr:hypothetical protein AHF37_06806 [Paragonimus kellicotti]
MSTPQVAVVADESVEILKQFKFRKSKTNDVLIMKIDSKSLMVQRESFMEDTSLDELSNELPSHEPRYILITFRHEKPDGRVVYPYCMVFSTPEESDEGYTGSDEQDRWKNAQAVSDNYVRLHAGDLSLVGQLADIVMQQKKPNIPRRAGLRKRKPGYEGCPPMLKMLYTASLSNVVQKSEVNKVFELREVEDFSENWLRESLENER